MTTNKPGSVNQNPLFGCMSCFLDHSWPAEDLRVYGGECWCDLCWGELRWGVDDLPYWDELPRFIPPYVAELEALQAECEKLRKDAERIEWLEAQTKKSYTGISFDYHRHVEDGYVVDHGYRFMRRHFASGFKDSLRKAIDAAMAGGDQ